MNEVKKWSGPILLILLMVEQVSGFVPAMFSYTINQSTAQNSTSVERYTPDQLCADVDFYVRLIDQAHINPYAIVPRADYFRRAEEIKSSIRREGPMTQRDFWLRFAPLVNSIGDSHTFINDYNHKTLDDPSIRFLPLFTAYRDGKLTVVSSRADETIPVGSVIRSVNGMSAEKVLEELSVYYAGTKREKLSRAGVYFWSGLSLMLRMRDQYQVTFDDGRDVMVRGLTIEEMNRKAEEMKSREKPAANENSPSNDPLVLKFLDGGFAYLASRSFSYDLADYKKLLEGLFTQIQSAKPRALIIDLRQNGGGNSALGQALIAMFNKRPYRSFSGTWKRSAQYAEYLRGGKVPFDDSSVKKYLKAAEGKILKLPADQIKPEANVLRYEGPVYVISGERTFSSALMFVAEVQDGKLATVVGQETLAPACHYGELYSSRLPNTGLRVGLSVKQWIRPSGNCDGRGVVPDVPINVSSGQNDRMLDAVLDLIKQRHETEN